MANRSLGTLTLDIVAKIGGFEQGMDKAARISQKRVREIETSARKIGAVVATAFVASATGIAAFVSQQAEAIAGFQDLSEKIGDTAENVASLQRASAVSGVSFDTIAAASIRLTAALSKTDDEGKGVGRAIQALELNFEDFKKQAPIEQIDSVAKALGRFEDGAGKTAVAVALFGKSGAELLPLLNELNDGAQRHVTLSAEQIRQADEYSKAVSALWKDVGLLGQQYASSLIPVLRDTIDVINELTGGVDGLNSTSMDLAMRNEVKEWGQDVVLVLATAAESAVGLVKALGAIGGSFKAVFADIELVGKFIAKGGVLGLASEENRKELGDALNERNAIVERANKDYIDLWSYNGTALTDALSMKFSGAGKVEKIDEKKPKLDYSGVPEKSAIDGQADQIKSIIGALKEQADTLGLNAAAVEQYKLSLLGATPAQLEMAESLRASIDVFESLGLEDSLQKQTEEFLDRSQQDLESWKETTSMLGDVIEEGRRAAERKAEYGIADSTKKGTYRAVDDAVGAAVKLEEERYAKRREALQAALEQEQGDRELARQAIEAAEVAHQEKLNEISLQGEMAKGQITKAYTEITLQTLGNAADAAMIFGKKGFAAYKALSIAQTLISTYKAAQEAFSSLAGIPVVGPVLGGIAAGAVGSGLARVAQIRAMEPGYKMGGYTGDYGMDEVAGVVHGKEFVLNANATRQYRPVLEAMNSGSVMSAGAMGALPSGAVGASVGQAPEVQIVNNGAPVKVVSQQWDGQQMRLVIDTAVQIADARATAKTNALLNSRYALQRKDSRGR